jgi:RNA recognition motif-containing protein
MIDDQKKRLYVGNLPYSIRTPDLRQMFASFGNVEDVVVMMEAGQQDRSKGFGFVTMSNAEEAERAALAMNGKEVESRELVCNVAKPR